MAAKFSRNGKLLELHRLSSSYAFSNGFLLSGKTLLFRDLVVNEIIHAQRCFPYRLCDRDAALERLRAAAAALWEVRSQLQRYSQYIPLVNSILWCPTVLLNNLGAIFKRPSLLFCPKQIQNES